MGAHSFRMVAIIGASADIIVNANFFVVWGTQFAVHDFGPDWFAVSEFGWVIVVGIMFRDRMAVFTAEEATGQVR